MALSIKDTEADRLARRLTELTGESLTTAVTKALRERVKRLEKEASREARFARVDEITERFCESVRASGEPFTSTDHAELLYDEEGLPR